MNTTLTLYEEINNIPGQAGVLACLAEVALANGVSRKTFLLANLFAACLMSAALAIYIMIVLLVHRLFWPLILVSHLAYPGISLAGLLLAFSSTQGAVQERYVQGEPSADGIGKRWRGWLNICSAPAVEQRVRQ